jgi:hypothetical protein
MLQKAEVPQGRKAELIAKCTGQARLHPKSQAVKIRTNSIVL